MSGKMNALIALLLCGSLSIVVDAADRCGACTEGTDILCINSTTYQYCMHGVRQPRTFECAPETYCSNSDEICSADISKALCPNSVAQCECITGWQTRCTSKNEYQSCRGTTSIKCEDDLLCVQMGTQAKCMPQCAIDFMKLDLGCPNTSSKPPLEELNAVCEAKKTGKPSTFILCNEKDKSGTSYIFCENFDGAATATYFQCDEGTFFDLARERCVKSKPKSCVNA